MKREAGNALFLILIAVALFAALSYAITNSSRGAGDLSKEQARLSASQILQYGTQIEQQINRLKLVNGCAETDISFHYDSNGNGSLDTDGSDDYYNSGSGYDCYLFHQDGGGLVFRKEKQTSFAGQCVDAWCGAYTFTADSAVPGVGSTENELIVFLPDIQEPICAALNQGLNGSSAIPTSNYWLSKFTGTYSSISTLTVPNGQRSGCFQFSGVTGEFTYYHVLLTR